MTWSEALDMMQQGHHITHPDWPGTPTYTRLRWFDGRLSVTDRNGSPPVPAPPRMLSRLEVATGYITT